MGVKEKKPDSQERHLKEEAAKYKKNLNCLKTKIKNFIKSGIPCGIQKGKNTMKTCENYSSIERKTQ